jgi:uncharacterized HAD superfamily protein
MDGSGDVGPKAMNYRSITDLAGAVRDHLHLIPTDVDVVVGVPRSGLLLANMIALQLNLPLTDVEGLCGGEALGHGHTRLTDTHKARFHPDKWRVGLVVDDSVASGHSIDKIKQRLAQANLNIRLLYLSAYVLRTSRSLVDIYFEVVNMPRMFEWNVMHHPLLASCCVDFDGVLCKDPSDVENDDGPRYREFLLNADLMFRCTHRIGWIVTSRLEKYRLETEAWLHRNDIAYDNLMMLNLPDAATRRRLGVHASFKAEVFKRTGALLFIESEEEQARDIARLSGKHALCITTQQFYQPDLVSIAGLSEQGRFFLKRATQKVRRLFG